MMNAKSSSIRFFYFLIAALVLAPFGALSDDRERGSHAPLLIETQWLEENSRRSDIRIVDFGRSLDEYNAGHIPGAVYLETKVVWDNVDGIPGMLPNVDTVVRTLEKAGISNDLTVVIYDSIGGLWASRLFWALEYLGHQDVHLLNGGWNKWVQEGRRVQRYTPSVQRGNFTAQIRPDRLATKEWILQNLDNPDVQIVDTRSPAEYTGEDVRAAQGGHIPGAVNIDWVLNLTGDDQNTFLFQEELAEMYDSQDVTRDKVAVTHCQTGVRGAHTYFVLRLLGYPEVRVYDGSWAEWGNAEDTPILKGKAQK
jgi:thiosulfate/3-mercaptopyruvate sulfurtransferase